MDNKNKLFIFVGILAVIALAFFLLGGSPFQKLAPQEKEEQEIAEINGILDFEPLPTSPKEGDVFPVNITVNSDGEPIVGADILVTYDPLFLIAKSSDGMPVEVEKDYLVLFPADGQTKENLFQFSVITQQPKDLNGRIATIYFTAKKAGKTKLGFMFEEGKTSDSNLALSGRGVDILASVGEALVEIGK